MLYSVQLLHWGVVEPGTVQLDPRVEDDIRQNVEAMVTWPPEQAMEALVGDLSPEGEVMISDQDLQGSPKEAAAVLADSLNSYLTENLPGYRAPGN